MKIFLYTAAEILSVNFLFFDSNGELQETVAGTQNQDLVWEATIPALIAGTYTVVGKSGTKTLGKEEINWNGTTIVEPAVTIAKAIRTELSSELVHLVSLQNGLTSGQSTMLLELYQLMGLDPLKPLIVTSSNRKVSDGTEISQTIQNLNGEVTVTRVI